MNTNDEILAWNWTPAYPMTHTHPACWNNVGISQERAEFLKAKYGGYAWQSIPQADSDPVTGVEYGSLS